MRSATRDTPSRLLLTGCRLIDSVSDDPMRNAFSETLTGTLSKL